MNKPETRSPDAPLEGIRVVDFSTLLPGPLATLLLRRAGAEVIKIEPPGGEAMRTLMGDGGAAFELLNRGKRSVCVDLKQPAARDAVRALCASADVVVEQFRPGVMERLGLDYPTLARTSDTLIYCAITGYGHDGPLRAAAGHDINYLAESGLFSLFRDAAGRPVPPPVLLADVVGGAYPAFSNILLALFDRLRNGRGAFIDIAMTRGLQALSVSATAAAARSGVAPSAALDGRAANYRCYECADGQWLAVGALEEKFWRRLCAHLQLPAMESPPSSENADAVAEVAGRFAEQPAHVWLERFGDDDVCCNAVRTLPDVVAEWIDAMGPELPLPIAPAFDHPDGAPAPAVGEANSEWLGTPADAAER